MCGIAGFVGMEYKDGIANQMLATMNRRGPDSNGIYKFREGCLLHSRLAVIDIVGGMQPMCCEFHNETYTIVYNGELYNTEELRSLLQKLGHTFLSHSDTEVVLHAYAQWSDACVDKLNGIFAFAVWESKRKRLFLARDRMGVKPLFYKLHNDGIIFASEIKTILKYPDVSAELDETGVAQLLMLGPGRIPGSGVLRGIFEVEPGCCGYFYHKKWSWKRYWKFWDKEHRDSFDETVETVRYLVTDSIKRQMVSDVPIGTFLSGGLDSSLISSICAKELADRGERLYTFSVDYENNDKYFVPGKFQPNSDGSYIRIMQEYLDTEHYWSVFTPDELVAALEVSTDARDLPGMADVDFSLLAFCREIRPHVKVALSGECADEIFGGYPWYRDPAVRNSNGFPWAQNTQKRAGLLSPRISVNAQDYVMDAYENTCKESDVLPGTSALERRMKEMMNLNFCWFMQTLLDRKDRMSMYCGLEVRVPFCDYRIAEYLYAVPWEYKDYRNREKGLLRYAAEGLLPHQVQYRKKSPYPKTFDPEYESMVSADLETLLPKKDSPLLYLLNGEAVKQYLAEDTPWPWYGQLMRRPQVIAYLLQTAFWLDHYQIELLF